jgi:hypothetical protein
VVRIPSFARRPETATATEDRNRDGRIDERDRPADPPVADARGVTEREKVDDRGPRHGAATGTATVVPADTGTRREADTETRRERADEATAERAEAERAEAERADTERTAERTADTTVEGPKPRASLLATLGLVVGVAAALTVLTGLLAGYGIALGIAGLLLSIGGLSATGKRHVAGKSDALLGIALNVGAMIVGALALTGALPWLTTETDKVDQLRQWLDTQFGERF